MILHFVRHPPPQVPSGVCYGRLDVPATKVEATAERLRGLLPADLPVWTSPLARCRALAECLHPGPLVDERLAEMHFGDWEGMHWDRIGAAALGDWAADVAGFAPPGGESARAVQDRALDFVAGVDVEESVLVTHAGIMRVLLTYWRGMPMEACADLAFRFGCVTTVELLDSGATIHRLNR